MIRRADTALPLCHYALSPWMLLAAAMMMPDMIRLLFERATFLRYMPLPPYAAPLRVDMMDDAADTCDVFAMPMIRCHAADDTLSAPLR